MADHRYLRAIFRFKTSEDTTDALMPPLKLLLRTLRIIRISDPHASLRVVPDDEPPAYDQDGD